MPIFGQKVHSSAVSFGSKVSGSNKSFGTKLNHPGGRRFGGGGAGQQGQQGPPRSPLEMASR